MRAIVVLLDPEERDLVARYYFDRQTQSEIGIETGRPQQTVAYRIGRAVERLRAAGIDIATTGRGRRRERVDLIFCDPDALDRLLVRESSGGGPKTGVWVDADQRAE